MGTGYGKVLSLTLPSGNKVRVKRVSLLTMVKLNQIPSELISAVWAVFGREDPAALPQDQTERVNTMVELMDQAVKSVLVDIKIVTGDDLTETDEDKDGFMIGTVNVRDIPDSDKTMMFGFAQGVMNADAIQVEAAKQLGKFPDLATGEVAGSGSEAVRTETEQHDQVVTQESAGARL